MKHSASRERFLNIYGINYRMEAYVRIFFGLDINQISS